MVKVSKNTVLDTLTVCPYCMGQLGETWYACCGEAGHGAEATEIEYPDGSAELVLLSEIEFIN